MGFAKKYKKKKFDIDTSNFEYNKLSELYEENGKDALYHLCGVYINTKGNFGDSPVFATDFCFVNIPAHLLDTAREILNCEEDIQAINSGKVAFKIYQYTDQKHNRICYSVEFFDIDENGEITE